jgi:hypothetical protein
MPSPTEKQIKLAEDIARVLGINFPTSSKEFNKRTYRNFINAYYDEFKMVLNDANDICFEDEISWFQMLNG